MNTPSQGAQPSKRGGFRPGSGRKPGSRNKSHRLFQRDQLVAAFVGKLGGADRVDPIVMADVVRAADLVALAAEMRQSGAVRQGKIRLAELTSLEGLALRAVKALNLPAPDAVATPPTKTLHDFAAMRTAEEAD
jgi:hypothetical protein